MFCGPSSASVVFVEYRCTCGSFLVTSRVHPRVEIQLLNGLPFVQLWSGGYATAVICFPCQHGKDWKDRFQTVGEI